MWDHTVSSSSTRSRWCNSGGGNISRCCCRVTEWVSWSSTPSPHVCMSAAATAVSLASAFVGHTTWLGVCGWLRQWPCLAAWWQTTTPPCHAVVRMRWCQTALAALFCTGDWISGCRLGHRECRTVLCRWKNNEKQLNYYTMWTLDQMLCLKSEGDCFHPLKGEIGTI